MFTTSNIDFKTRNERTTGDTPPRATCEVHVVHVPIQLFQISPMTRVHHITRVRAETLAPRRLARIDKHRPVYRLCQSPAQKPASPQTERWQIWLTSHSQQPAVAASPGASKASPSGPNLRLATLALQQVADDVHTSQTHRTSPISSVIRFETTCTSLGTTIPGVSACCVYLCTNSGPRALGTSTTAHFEFFPQTQKGVAQRRR